MNAFPHQQRTEKPFGPRTPITFEQIGFPTLEVRQGRELPAEDLLVFVTPGDTSSSCRPNTLVMLSLLIAEWPGRMSL
jgi:hypothetical protein